MSSSEPAPHPPHPPQPRWLKPAGIVGLILALAIVVFGLVNRGMASQKLKTWTTAQAIPTVSVITPTATSGADALTLPGDVQPDYNAVIHARVSGYLKRWYVDIGAQVKAGQLLADIDTPELDEQLAQARANLATATANQKFAQVTAARWTSLLQKDAVSHQEADEKTSDLEAKTTLVQAAKAEVDRLAALESFKRIVAPFAGVVTARNTDVGALIAAGNPSDPGLFSVADVRRLRVYVHTPQSYAAQVRTGQTASLTVPEYPGQTFPATVSSTSGAISDQSGSLLVELQTDNSAGTLKPGDYAQVRFSLPAKAGGVQLPASAIMFRRKGIAVATVGPNDRVVIKYVAIGQDLGSAVDIASGLSPSDRVIDNPPDSIGANDQVRIAVAGARSSRGEES
jgi:RND family efflux transporter MFP subunit